MEEILNNIQEWFVGLLKSCIISNLDGMFDSINSGVGTIGTLAGMTPAQWNAGVFSMIRSISNYAIVPVAGMILTAILCYELITMVMEKNNLHDVDTWMFFKWIFKVFVAVFLVTHTFDITMSIFEIAQYIVQHCTGLISGSASINFAEALGNVEELLEEIGAGEMFGLLMETLFLRITAPAISICIMLVLLGRIIEIYIFCSVGAIPFATIVNREWGQIGTHYLRSLAALGLQGFFIMICVAVYTVLVGQIGRTNSIHTAIWACIGYTILLCFALFKTSAVSKSICNAH